MATHPTIVPSAGSSLKNKAAATRYTFGDGYSQRVNIGINGVRRTWNVAFYLLDATDAATLDAFLVAQKGASAFDWTPPHGAAGKWTCAEWNFDAAKVTQDMNAQYVEEFDI